VAAVQDRLHDVGGEKRHAQDAADIGSVDLLCRGRLLDDPVGAGLKQLAPPEDPFNADGWTARVRLLKAKGGGAATAAQGQDCVGLKGQTLGWNEATIVDAVVAARSGPDQAGQIR
jgi:hypothetical protein